MWTVVAAEDLYESGAESCDHHAYCQWFGDREHVRRDAHLAQDPNIWHMGSYAFGLQELCCLALILGRKRGQSVGIESLIARSAIDDVKRRRLRATAIEHRRIDDLMVIVGRSVS